MLLTVLVPLTAVQVPHELIRNHQLLLLGPFDKLRSTERSEFTVAVRTADGMTKYVSTMKSVQPAVAKAVASWYPGA